MAEGQGDSKGKICPKGSTWNIDMLNSTNQGGEHREWRKGVSDIPSPRSSNGKLVLRLHRSSLRPVSLS
jgi:hypothetical protein